MTSHVRVTKRSYYNVNTPGHNYGTTLTDMTSNFEVKTLQETDSSVHDFNTILCLCGMFWRMNAVLSVVSN